MSTTLPNNEVVAQTQQALEQNGFTVLVVENKDEALAKISTLIEQGSEVMAMTSVTLDQTGISKLINESGQYSSAHKKLYSLDSKTQKKEMKTLGCIPTYAVGSVQAISQDGKIFSASNTGSQLPAYAYGANKVIWVVGINKIVQNFDEGIKRMFEVALPLEGERAKKAYGVAGSAVNKILITNHENIAGRSTVMLVKESLGY